MASKRTRQSNETIQCNRRSTASQLWLQHCLSTYISAEESVKGGLWHMGWLTMCNYNLNWQKQQHCNCPAISFGTPSQQSSNPVAWLISWGTAQAKKVALSDWKDKTRWNVVPWNNERHFRQAIKSPHIRIPFALLKVKISMWKSKFSSEYLDFYLALRGEKRGTQSGALMVLNPDAVLLEWQNGSHASAHCLEDPRRLTALMQMNK